jgi:hypothetical protein
MTIFPGPRSNNSSMLGTGNVVSQPIPDNSKNLNYNINVSNSNEIKPNIDSAFISQNSHARTPTKFENLANISQQRPEILMMTNFDPLYKEDKKSKTDFGNLFDLNVETMRQLDATAQKLLNDLNQKDFIDGKNKAFQDQVTTLRNYLADLLNVLKTLSHASSNLNLHNSIYDFSPADFAARLFDDNNTKKTSKSSLDPFIKKLPETLNLDLALQDALDLASSKKHTSTKLWLESANELRTLLMGFSRHARHVSKSESTGIITDDDPTKLPFASNFTLSGHQSNNQGTGRSPFYTFQDVAEIPDGVVFTNSGSNYTTVAHKPLFESITRLEKYINAEINSSAREPLIFHLISKEVRQSYCFNQQAGAESLKYFLPNGGGNINEIYNGIFGLYRHGQDVFKNVSSTNVGTSLADFVYSKHIDDNTKTVLTVEEKQFSNTDSNLIAGGNYFFSEENVFDNIENNSLNLSRITEIQKVVTKLDSSFFDIMSNFGMMTIDDSTLSQPLSFFSFNPSTFMSNVASLLVDDFGASKIYTKESAGSGLESGNDARNILFKQEERGICALFARAGQSDSHALELRSALLLVVFEMMYSTDSSLGKFDANLETVVRGFSWQYTGGDDVDRKILHDQEDMAYWIVNTLNDLKGNTDTELNIAMDRYKSLFENQNSGRIGGFRYVPCKYDNANVIGGAIRNSNIVSRIASVIKEVIDAYQQYACNGGKTSVFSGVSIDTIAVLMFSAICMLCERFSDDVMIRVHRDESPVSIVQDKGVWISSDSGNIDAGQHFSKSEDFSGLNAEDFQNVLNWLGFATYSMVVYVKHDSIPHNQDKQHLISIAEKEMLTLLSMSTAVLNVLDTLNSNITAISATITKFNSTAIQYLLSYLDNNKDNLSLVLKENQLMLLLSNVEDLYQNLNDFSDDANSNPDANSNLFVKKIETLSHSVKIVDALESLLKDQEYTTHKGYNKKIISVGIPQGLFRDLSKNSSLDIKSNKHNDIFKIVIRKMDLVNGEIIYLPKEYLFEASRYPVRIYSSINQLDDTVNIDEIISSISTRNYSLFHDPNVINTGETSYWNDKSNVFGNEYSFLTDSEKKEIIENHVISFLLENYLKTTSGVLVNENTFVLDAKKIVSSIDPDLKQKFAAANVGAGIIFNNSKELFTPILDTVFPPPDVYLKNMLQPKKFDRVFNIIFDPEFEVDYSKTTFSATGTNKLNKLIKENKIYPISIPKKQYADVDKTSKDPSLDLFFVSIETHAEEVSSNANFASTSSNRNSTSSNRNFSSMLFGKNQYRKGR